MPSKPQTICSYPGCNTLTLRGRCPKHETRKEDERARTQRRRRDPENLIHFYDTLAWKRARDAHKDIEPLCRHCAAEGRTMLGVEVDHIIPIAEGGAELEDSNLQTLCKPCHTRKTIAEQRHKRRAGYLRLG